MNRQPISARLLSLGLSVVITSAILFGLDGLATSAPSDQLLARTAVSVKV